MLTKRALAVLAFVFVSGLADPAAAARSRQVVIGTLKLAGDGATATVDVSKAKGAYRALRIRANRGPVDVTGLRFVYDDDSFHTIDKQFRLNRREQTKLLDDRDGDRFVNSVFVSYKASKEPMEVQIIGVQSREGARKVRVKPAAAPSPAPVAAVSPAATPATPPAAAVAAVPAPAKVEAKPAPVIADPKSIAEGRDVMFGYQSVGFAADRETIAIGSEVGKFHAIRLRVLDSDIHINEIAITYGDGTTQALGINTLVKRDQRTKWFQVNGNQFIKQIELVYKTRPKDKGRSRVEVVGQYTADWLAGSGEGRKFNEGWVLLGSKTAGSIGFDKDVVTIGKNEGGFSKVRLKVRDRSITLREIRVSYLDGSDDVIKSNDRVDPDQMAGPWDLKPGRPAIKEIVAVYRRRMIFGKGQGQAVVEFWGRH